MRGRKPTPTPLRLIDGNPGKRAINRREPQPPTGLPTCPAHLSPTAKAEWNRLARSLNGVGLLTQADRAALAAYCQAYGRWVEAERRLAETPTLLKTPSGYVQQSPWLSVANKQMELMARFMAELGLTPSARSRLALPPGKLSARGSRAIRRRTERFRCSSQSPPDHPRLAPIHRGSQIILKRGRARPPGQCRSVRRLGLSGYIRTRSRGRARVCHFHTIVTPRAGSMKDEESCNQRVR